MRYIHVKVTAGAGKESFRPRLSKKTWEPRPEDHFEVWVKEKAENNLANTRVLELVALYFKVSKNKVRIVNGHHHPGKLIIVED